MHSPHVDHSYCKQADDSDPPTLHENSHESKALRRERVRTTRLKKKVQHLQTVISNMTSGAQTVKQVIDGATKYLNGPVLSFFASQLRNSSRRTKARGRRWSYTDKVIALSLYHQGPRAYQHSSRIFTLPAVSSLRRWLQSIEVHPGFNENIFEVMKHKVSSMKERESDCVVTFGEMSIRAGLTYDISNDRVEGFEDFGEVGRTNNVANLALVFLVRGMLSHRKQPVGYFLSKDASSADTQAELLKSCLAKLKEIGLYPKFSCL